MILLRRSSTGGATHVPPDWIIVSDYEPGLHLGLDDDYTEDFSASKETMGRLVTNHDSSATTTRRRYPGLAGWLADVKERFVR